MFFCFDRQALVARILHSHGFPMNHPTIAPRIVRSDVERETASRLTVRELLNHRAAALVLFLLAGLLVYSPALNGEPIWDDEYLVGRKSDRLREGARLLELKVCGPAGGLLRGARERELREYQNKGEWSERAEERGDPAGHWTWSVMVAVGTPWSENHATPS